MRPLALRTALVLATLTGLLVLWELRAALVLFALAVTTAAAVRPLVDALVARRVPRGLALGVATLLSLLVPGLLLVYLATGALAADVQWVADGLLPLYETVRDRWPQGTGLQRELAVRLPGRELAEGLRGEQLVELVRSAAGLGLDAFSFLGELMIVQLLAIFWVANREAFERLWLSLVSVDGRPRAQETWSALERGVGEKVRNDVTEGLLTVGLLYVGFLGIGLEHPLLPAVLGGLLRLVPLVGWLLALATTLVAGLATNPTVGVVAAAYVGVVMIGLEVVVAPRLMRARRYSSLLLTVVVLALADAHGVLGLLVAPAIAAALQTFFELRRTGGADASPAARPGTAALEERLVALRALMATPGLEPSRPLVNVVERLTALVAATEEATGQRAASVP